MDIKRKGEHSGVISKERRGEDEDMRRGKERGKMKIHTKNKKKVEERGRENTCYFYWPRRPCW